MHLDHCYAFGLLLLPSGLKKKFVEGEDPVSYLTTTLVRDHEHFIPTKFRKYPSIGSVGKADYVVKYIYMH